MPSAFVKLITKTEAPGFKRLISPSTGGVFQDSEIVTWTIWSSRLRLNGRPLLLNSCSMEVFSGNTSAMKVRSPAAQAILVR